MIKERYKKYAAIIQRAKEEGLHVNDKLSVLMDIESADRKFNIRLDEWLQADLFNFTHDLILSILVYTLFSRMFDLMQPPAVKHSIAVV